MSSNPANTGLNPEKLPSHVAIIMDGNGRWAQKRLLNRIKGHEQGAETVRMVVRTCREVGIKHLTLYAFSTENWERPSKEISALMSLLKKFLYQEKKEMLDNNIRLNTIGQVERLPDDVRAALLDTIEATRRNSGMRLNLGLSYGGRAEIVEAARKIARKAVKGEIDPEAVTPELFRSCLYTADMPDPELLIRTSGEYRISNFLLWQIAYSEIHVTRTLWPDLTREELVNILADFQNRERRFGRVD